MDVSYFRGIGLLMLVGMLVASLRRKAARSKSAVQLPQLAQKLGLQHHAPRNSGDVGLLTGTFNGYEIRIDPDEAARITVRFASAPRIELRTFPFFKRTPSGLTPLQTPFRQFQAYFVEHYASSAVAQALTALGNLDSAVAKFKATPQQIQSLSISAEGIDCRLKVKRVVCVSGATVQYLLPVLTDWARAIDSAQEPAGEDAASQDDEFEDSEFLDGNLD